MFLEDMGQSLPLNPTPPLQLLWKTWSEGSVFLETPSPGQLKTIIPSLPLSHYQETALKLCLHSPLMVIEGVPGSGKTRLGKVLCEGLRQQHKKVLLLSHHEATLSAYKIRSRGVPESSPFPRIDMDFLPPHLLPDYLLRALRKGGKLEKWVAILRDGSQEIDSLLASEFPDIPKARLNLLKLRLQNSLPLLEKQLALQQQSARLSDEALASLLSECGALPISTTVAQFFQPANKEAQKATFDCIIVEESEYLEWPELASLATMTDKLILLGDLNIERVYRQRKDFSEFAPFEWLSQYLCPAYRYRLPQQFRLHFSIARPIIGSLYRNTVIETAYRHDSLHLPVLFHRWGWQEVRSLPADDINTIEGRRLLQYLTRLDGIPSDAIGVLTFTTRQKQWLRENLPAGWEGVFIGNIEDWAGKEIPILLISCVGYPEKLKRQDLKIALTRCRDYLILFGNGKQWLKFVSPLQSLLTAEEIQREREVLI